MEVTASPQIPTARMTVSTGLEIPTETSTALVGKQALIAMSLISVGSAAFSKWVRELPVWSCVAMTVGSGIAINYFPRKNTVPVTQTNSPNQEKPNEVVIDMPAKPPVPQENALVTKWTWKVLDTGCFYVCTIGGALLFLQLPKFISHYIGYVSGQCSILKPQYEHWLGVCVRQNATVSQLINAHRNDTNPLVTDTATTIEDVMYRAPRVNATVEGWKNATSPLQRMWVWGQHADLVTVRGSVETYRPGLEFTQESVISALAGIVIGYGIYLAGRRAICATYRLAGRLWNGQATKSPQST